MDRNALVVNGLTKRYQDFTLDGVSFTVPQGSVISYRADCRHTCRNVSKGITRAAMIINYVTHMPRQDTL